MRKSTRRVVTAGVVIASVVAALDRNGSVRRALRHARDDVSRRVRYLQGAAEGARYRIAGRRPDPNVTDDVLTQRVRSALGPLEKQRDLPRVHVMVEEGIVLLHGEVPSEHDMSAIERRVMEVSGVRSVISYLHIGLDAWHDTALDRPGRTHRALPTTRASAPGSPEAPASRRTALRPRFARSWVLSPSASPKTSVASCSHTSRPTPAPSRRRRAVWAVLRMCAQSRSWSAV